MGLIFSNFRILKFFLFPSRLDTGIDAVSMPTRLSNNLHEDVRKIKQLNTCTVLLAVTMIGLLRHYRERPIHSIYGYGLLTGHFILGCMIKESYHCFEGIIANVLHYDDLRPST